MDEQPLLSTNASANSDAGEYKIELSSVNDNNYDVTVFDGVLVIARADQMITFQSLPDDLTNFSSSFELVANSSSELPVEFTSSDIGIVSINETTATINSAGVVEISADQEGNVKFNPAETITITLTISEVLEVIEELSSAIKVFPNPSDGFFELEISDPTIKEVHLISMEGKTVRTYQFIVGRKYELGDVDDGLYMLHLEGAEGQNYIKKLVIKHSD